MAEWERDGDDGRGGTPGEDALERTLTAVGPLLHRRAAVGPPDPAFVARLRLRLTPDEAAIAPPVAAPAPVPRPRLVPWGGRGGAAGLVAAALVAAVLIAVLVVVRPHRPARVPVAAWLPPLPSMADLTRGFPAPTVARAAGEPAPTVSRAAPAQGDAYAGRVTLATAPLPARVTRLRAFRLAAPATVASPARVARVARSLGIGTPVRRTVMGRTAWLVAVEGGGSSRRSPRSVAVSVLTGELVYHDAPYTAATRPVRWRDNAFAVAAARVWLTRLGWPAARMPLVAIAHSGLPTGLRAVAFGWVGVGAAATDAATLWVTPGGRVVEADVWPPVESARSIAVRDVTAAWTAVRGHTVPLAVEGVPPHTTAPGVGLMRDVTITHVLSTGADGRSYLVPAYHFVGTARLRGIHGEHICYALASAGGGSPTP